MQAANSKQGAPPPQCLDANITWCGDYHRQGIPDGHLCKWDPMGALFTLLNILDSADKLAHQNRVRETTVFYSVWVIGGMGQLCVSYMSSQQFTSIMRRVCIQKPGDLWNIPLKGLIFCLLKTAGKQSSLLLWRLYCDSVQSLPHTPDSRT